MKSGNCFLKRLRKIVTDPSFLAFILICLYGLVIYPGCFLNVTGLAIAEEDEDPVVDDRPGISPPDGCVGRYYSYDLHSWLWFDTSAHPNLVFLFADEDARPPGLELDGSLGIISGMPTEASADDGFGFDIVVVDTDDPESTIENPFYSEHFTIRVNDFSITTNSLPSICQGSTYNAGIYICGGNPPFVYGIDAESWSPSPLPVLLSFSSTDARENTLSGEIPADTSAGEYNFTLTVSDDRRETIFREFTILVTNVISILSAQHLPGGIAGTSYPEDVQLQACGGTMPYTWELTEGALPSGMNPLAADGTISGIPDTAGIYSFTARVTDSAEDPREEEKNFYITIAAEALTIVTRNVELFECTDVNENISTYVTVTGGLGERHWEIDPESGLPSGLEFTEDEGNTFITGRATIPNMPDGSTVILNYYDATTGPDTPREVELTIHILPNPADSGVNVVNVRQWSADPSSTDYYPDRLNRLYLAVIDRAIKVDCTISDAAWGTEWWATLVKQATLTIVGSCMGGEVTTTTFREDYEGRYVAVFDFGMVRALIEAAGGVEASPHTFRLKLDVLTEPNPTDPLGERFGRSVAIEVTDDVPE